MLGPNALINKFLDSCKCNCSNEGSLKCALWTQLITFGLFASEWEGQTGNRSKPGWELNYSTQLWELFSQLLAEGGVTTFSQVFVNSALEPAVGGVQLTSLPFSGEISSLD